MTFGSHLRTRGEMSTQGLPSIGLIGVNGVYTLLYRSEWEVNAGTYKWEHVVPLG